mmetsp:Transcript_7099/g.12714  ORF Transcript_7099/g.12714 Transcript_7099/m.12714 type:complete len:107 (+) Transcript_7099:1114-1434(+)
MHPLLFGDRFRHRIRLHSDPSHGLLVQDKPHGRKRQIATRAYLNLYMMARGGKRLQIEQKMKLGDGLKSVSLKVLLADPLVSKTSPGRQKMIERPLALAGGPASAE